MVNINVGIRNGWEGSKMESLVTL